VADLVAENPGLTEVFARLGGGAGAVDSFLAGITGILGVLAAAYAVQAMLRVRDEESSGQAEVVLSTGVSRSRWLSSHAVFAFGGPAAALVAGGAVTGLVHGLASGDVAGELAAVTVGTLAQVPAVWVLAAVAAGLVGVLPRLASIAWGAVAVCLLVLLAGATLGLSQWVLDVSPFTHIPHLPGGAARVTPFVSLILLAVLLTAAGFAGLRRRDVPGA
jgi:ABC-2 type transport system permease protein